MTGLKTSTNNSKEKRKKYADTQIIHANTHTYMYTRNLYMKNMACLDMWKGLLKKEKFQLNFDVRECGKILGSGRQI